MLFDVIRIYVCVSLCCGFGFQCLRFEDEENEESYKMLRNRERRQVYFHNYAEEYCSATEYGELVIQQRLRMVHWIVEVSYPRSLVLVLFVGVINCNAP